MASSHQDSPLQHSAPGGDTTQGMIPDSSPRPAGVVSEHSEGAAAPGSSSSPPPPQQQQGSNGIYDLFLTAVGLTPRGLGTDAFSGGPGAGAEEEDFWTATHEGERDDGVGEGGGGGAGNGGHTLPLRSSPQQQPAEGTATTGLRTEPQEAAGVISRPPPAAADMGNPYNRLQQEGLAEMRRFSAEAGVGTQPTQTTQPTTLTVGTARRRRRPLYSDGASAAGADAGIATAVCCVR